MTSIISEMRRVVNSVIGDEQQASDVVYALISTFGGERLYVPQHDCTLRNQEMRELHQAGVSAEQLAARYRLAKTTIWRIIQRADKS